jgi:hypothetical protein
MNFTHHPVVDIKENFKQIVDHEVIDYFLTNCGGYIAGGLAEKVYNGLNINHYLKSAAYHYNGDIDIYFETKLGHQKALQYARNHAHTYKKQTEPDSMMLLHDHFDISSYSDFIITMDYQNDHSFKGKYNKKTYDRNKHIRHLEKSCTDISHQAYIDIELYNVEPDKDEPIKVQLIGKDFIGSVEEILSTFDFANVQIAYYKKAGQLFCCKSSQIPQKGINDRLKIVNSHSPLLMHRIYKYITHRGYVGITEDSKQHIIDWLILARSGHFKNPVSGITLWADALNNNIIKRAIYDRTIPDEALPIIIGKVITEKKVYRGYRRYDYVKIDEALEAIKLRNNT